VLYPRCFVGLSVRPSVSSVPTVYSKSDAIQTSNLLETNGSGVWTRVTNWDSKFEA